jgi:oxygen-independent coproporphyrinogen-3 oxidase
MNHAISTDILEQFDVPGPRYTSYPTADRFVEAYGEPQYLHALQERQLTSRGKFSPLSLYVHIPFCESLCYYCACNKIITGQYQRAIDYLADLDKEVNLLMPHLGPAQVVSKVHLGGGTPTFFRDKELHQLMGLLQSRFQWQKGGEFAIEVDPRTVDGQRLQTLWSLGFNRLSLGVQDFDPQVQEAVHRVQSVDQVRGLIDRFAQANDEKLAANLGSIAHAQTRSFGFVWLRAFACTFQASTSHRCELAAHRPPEDTNACHGVGHASTGGLCLHWHGSLCVA